MTPRKKQIIWILIIFACVVLVDQTTKAIVLAVQPEPARWLSMEGGPKFFQISHQRNPGVVNGIFMHRPALALAAPLLATCVLLYLFRFVDPISKVQTAAFGLIAGGAVGNLIDRLRLGSVTDFLQFHFYFIPFDFPWKLYPAFNVADSCICTGVFLLIVSWYGVGRRNAVHTT